MEGTRAAPGSSPPGFESLPPELVTAILSRSSLSSVIAIAQVSRGLRRLCTSEHVAWTTPCNRAAIEAGIHVFDSDRNDERSNEAFEHLAGLGVRSCVPPRAFVLLYPNLSRNFLLYHAELPRLKDDSWKEICEGRFSVSAMTSEKEKEREAGGVPSKGRWKEAFFRIIGKLEHRVETGCSKEEHLLHYIVLHRKHGLTSNRMATREFDPLRAFDELKLQNALRKHTTVQVLIPPHPGFGSADIQISTYVSIGRNDSFLRNDTMMDVLDALGGWRGKDEGHAILGPALMTASIRPSPEAQSIGLTSAIHVSLDMEDFEGAGLTMDWWSTRCGVHRGGGFV